MPVAAYSHHISKTFKKNPDGKCDSLAYFASEYTLLAIDYNNENIIVCGGVGGGGGQGGRELLFPGL